MTFLPALDSRQSIVDPETGKANQYFLDYLRNRNGALTDAEADILDLLNRQIIAGNGLDGGGPLSANVTIDANASSILDLIGSTRGSVLYRGASGWAALTPGTSGQFLKTNGAGADPTWAAGGGSTAWTVLYSNAALTNPTTSVDIAVSAYNDVAIIGRDITTASAANRGVYLSVDGGSTFYNTNSDYYVLSTSGTETGVWLCCYHGTGSTSARSIAGQILGLQATGPKLVLNTIGDRSGGFIGSNSPITHIRVGASASSGGALVNMTGGSLYVYGR